MQNHAQNEDDTQRMRFETLINAFGESIDALQKEIELFPEGDLRRASLEVQRSLVAAYQVDEFISRYTTNDCLEVQ